jgi:hypothetical protein
MGGAREGDGGGSRCWRIRIKVLGSVMKARIRNRPPHSQRRGSDLKTRRMRFAQRFRRAARCLEMSAGSSVSERACLEEGGRARGPVGVGGSSLWRNRPRSSEVHADEVEAHLFATGIVEIVIPVNQTAEGRFWQNLSRFTGTVDASGRGQGLWTCAPFDIDTGGYLDESVVAQGSWQMAPQE